LLLIQFECVQWLVVGAGGLGCEALKNLVMMGVGCSSNGSITITDMDVVSKPNLVDQLLYQLEDVDRAKAPAAARALRTINPSAQIHALQVDCSSSPSHPF
jgi:molybdopterin/thiamine biosynthesis adenylyltransferase